MAIRRGECEYHFTINGFPSKKVIVLRGVGQTFFSFALGKVVIIANFALRIILFSRIVAKCYTSVQDRLGNQKSIFINDKSISTNDIGLIL